MDILTEAEKAFDVFYNQQLRPGKFRLDIALQELSTKHELPERIVKAYLVIKLGKIVIDEKNGCTLPQESETIHWSEVITDGFEHYWNKTCPKCEQPTMCVVRPGVARCGNGCGCKGCDPSCRRRTGCWSRLFPAAASGSS